MNSLARGPSKSRLSNVNALILVVLVMAMVIPSYSVIGAGSGQSALPQNSATGSSGTVANSNHVVPASENHPASPL